MSVYDKTIKNVAEVAAKIMDEALKGNQHKIDANKNNKIDSQDFKILRGEKKTPVKEEIDLQEKSDDYEVKQSKTDPDVHHVHYKGKKIGYVYGNKKDMWGHEYHAMGTGDDGHSSKREAVSALKADHKHHISGAYMKESGEMGPVKNTKGSVLMRHKTSGKEINIINTPEAVKQHQARGYEKVSTVKKEEVELQEMSDMIDALIQEYESKGGVYKHKGTYGYGGKGAEHGETDYAKENELAKAADKPAKKKYGARQNYVRSTRVNESFTELLEKYTEGGVKALNETFYITEEADNEQFTAELEVNKKKAEGTAKQPEVAKGAVKAVAITKEETEQIEEREMTEPEMKKREEIVKSMKKGMAGFKQRYGERAKSVMYATATKQAMKD